MPAHPPSREKTDSPSSSADSCVDTSLCITPMASFSPDIPATRGSPGDLIDHYASRIAPIMVWLDSHKNGYKLLVLPLAETQPLLALAIQTIAAAHVAGSCDVDLEGFTISAIRVVTDAIASVLSPGQSMDDTSLIGLLASTLILSNRSLLLSDTGTANLHRQAARLVFQSLSIRSSSNNDDLVVFLQNQLAVYEILACTTLSNEEQIKSAVMPRCSTKHDLFRQFLELLHQVTLSSITALPDCSQDSQFTTAADLVDRFEVVMGQNLLSTGGMLFDRPYSFQQDFVRLVSAYHHAAILYALERLRLEDTSGLKILHAEKLVLALQGLHDIEGFLHNLPWPVFILGTVARESVDRQETVRSLCTMLVQRTGFKHYQQMLHFLEEFWRTDKQSWLDMAFELESRGLPLVTV